MNLHEIKPWEDYVTSEVTEDFAKQLEISQSRSRIFLLNAKLKQLEEQVQSLTKNPVAWYNASTGGFWLDYNRIPQYEIKTHDIITLYSNDPNSIKYKYTKDFSK